MKIVIATPILFDPRSPFNHLLRDILEGMVKAGHEVTRIAAVENEDENTYQMGLREIRHIPVIRKRADKGNIVSRYIKDTLTNIRIARRLSKLDTGDVLFEDVGYSSFWTVRAAKKKGLKVVAMLQDIWPDNAVQSGLIKEGSLIYRYFEMWQRYIYKKADAIICISDDMKAFLVSKGVQETKIKVIYNWAYGDDEVVIPWAENTFVKKFHLKEDLFYPVYAGNIGRMQNVELLIEAAEILKEQTQIHFLIIGDGVCKDKINRLIKEKRLDNVSVYPLQPSSYATSIYSAAGVNLISLVKGGTKTALPSKTGVCLSCGRPVIFCFDKDSKFHALCEKYDVGECVSSTDAADLAKAIMRCCAERKSRNAGSVAMYTNLFTRSKNIQQYVDMVGNV